MIRIKTLYDVPTYMYVHSQSSLFLSLKKKLTVILSVSHHHNNNNNNIITISLILSAIYVLGSFFLFLDRSIIDNPIWSFIMHICSLKRQDNLVEELQKFINSEFNLASLLYFVHQRGVVIIDTHISRNRSRMLRRCKGGDIFRSRIKNLPLIQSITYYCFARLFGWKIYTVPYNLDGSIDSVRYDKIADEILAYFKRPNLDPKNLPKNASFLFEKPTGDFEFDHDHAKAIGIFK